MIRRRRGFTLFELIVALSIFSVVGLISMGSLQYLLSVREQTVAPRAHVLSVHRAHVYLERDLQQVIDRSIITEFGELESAWIGRGEFTLPPSLFLNEQLVLSLTRWAAGSDAFGSRQADMVRVDYFLRDNDLIRQVWSVLDRFNTGAQAQQEVILRDIENMSVRYISGDASEVIDWYLATDSIDAVDPLTGVPAQEDYPRAIRIDIEMEGRVYDWLFRVGV